MQQPEADHESKALVLSRSLSQAEITHLIESAFEEARIKLQEAWR